MEVKPGYKRTEVGVIPQDWGVLPFDSVFRRVPARNYQIKTNEYQESGTHPVVDQGQLPVIGYSDQEDKVYRVPDGGVVIFGDHTCIVKLVNHDFVVGADGTQILTARPPQHSEFHAYALTHRGVAATGYNRHFKILKERRFQSPPPREQRAIATALSDVDALLGGLDRLIAKKRDLKQAAMQQLLTGQTRLPGFHGEWEVKRLGELGPFLKGRGVKKDETRSGDLPCIRYGEIYTHHNDYVKSFNSWISREVANTATRLRRGDVLFAVSGETKEEIGKCVAFVDDIEAYAGGDIVIQRPNGANSLFLGYLLNIPAVASQKASRGQGDAVVHISGSALASINLSLPIPNEQSAISTVLSDMDAELFALEARRDKTRAIKQAMMQVLLTGSTRLVSEGAADA